MSSCTEKSIAFQTTANNVIGAGTTIVIPDPESSANVYRALSVINDTDQDIKITFQTTEGIAQAFIVPKSIKGFTRVLKSYCFDFATFKAISMHASAPAVGIVTYNFST